MPFWKDRETVRYLTNALAAIAVLSLLGFPGLVGFAAGFIVNVLVPKWVGVD